MTAGMLCAMLIFICVFKGQGQFLSKFFISDIIRAFGMDIVLAQLTGNIEISVSFAKNFSVEILIEGKREHKIGSGVFLGTIHSVCKRNGVFRCFYP